MIKLAQALTTSLAIACFVHVPSAGHATGLPDLSGPWLMAQLTTTVSRIPVVGKIHAQSRLVSIHQLRHVGERLFGPGQLCELELDSGSRLVRTALSARARASLPAPRLDARVARSEHGEIGLWQPKQLLVVGARLQHPLTDPLPTRPDAPEVIDQDGDGHPGLTIEVQGIAPGRVYVVQRAWTELDGSMVAHDTFTGALRFDNEQIVLDASSFLLRRTVPTQPIFSRSWFRLQRLSPGSGCAAARAQTKGWFP